MSKDKSGKKDKLKHYDLFEMMLSQSQVFREMVAHFQEVWVPGALSEVAEATATNRPQAKTAKRGKVAPVAKPTRKRTPGKAASSAKATAAVTGKPPKKTPGRKAPASKKPATPAKTVGKVRVTRRSAK